ncbi:putative HxlR-family transcriptional regulator [Actinoplanes missouriensis 431]|uniref:Putative HxlR-family transcriptional regulator n=1 Tax=Actinoplanes missouriensis (strain ATCC 14538 / DSM 43046 / CBS 188.64 / JCM 3121 / NBRC 102363 / NCIMB 12654 / NRRL B-3342 / UNCC 431) TaxID=512565 RepID=I0GZ72_ACTM4|nr:helix-turn-helix domain-containing protein [Actinoplanes missouriensis]BAL86059.1 putative HxlR-family transcriptional regulator [Actinoplanes missouriensis 431]
MGTRNEISELPPEADLARADSLAREIFSDLANKWAFLIIEFLGQRTLRFSELRNEIGGVSHKMLTQNLRMLERNGLVRRIVHPTVPPRVEYTLTEAGEGLRQVVDGMCGWTQRYLGHIEASRNRFGDDAAISAIARSDDVPGLK